MTPHLNWCLLVDRKPWKVKERKTRPTFLFLFVDRSRKTKKNKYKMTPHLNWCLLAGRKQWKVKKKKQLEKIYHRINSKSEHHLTYLREASEGAGRSVTPRKTDSVVHSNLKLSCYVGCEQGKAATMGRDIQTLLCSICNRWEIRRDDWAKALMWPRKELLWVSGGFEKVAQYRYPNVLSLYL